MINFEAVGEAIWQAAAQALGMGAETVATRARSLAPVRRIFSEGGSSIRPKTMAEIHEVASARDAAFRAGGPPTVIQPETPGVARTITGKRPPRKWAMRRLSEASRLLEDYEAGDDTLSRRGAYEVREALTHPRPGSTSPSGRLSPSFATWGHLHVGGRLRGEIYATPVRVAGQQAEAWVISPTPYAKYQEFGTRHNAAHPYLRPAAAESQPEVVSRIAAAVREASRTGASSMQIEIEVRL